MKSILLILVATLGIATASTAQNVPSYIPTNGLVGWWPFNGNANDESGNGNDGTVNGATLTTDRFGNANKAYNFDGVNDFINTSYSGILGNNKRTISFWAKQFQTNTTNNNQLVLGWGSNVCGPTEIAKGFYCGFNIGAGGVSIDANESGTTYSTPYSVSDNLWHHYIFVLDVISSTTAQIKIFQDNVAVSQLTGSYNPSSVINTISQVSLTFGKRTFTCAPDRFYNGLTDDIAIWNRALTQEEITALYTASSTNNATSNTTANVPGAISYQAVARDAQGAPLADANLQVQFTLIADSLSGAAEYAETHSLTTNSMGLFTTAFGAGTPVSNTFGNINWTAGNKFLKVQMDTGNGWIDMGTQQLLSTPYSMHSATSGAIKNPGLPVFADNAAALAGGLVAGDMYRTASGDLKIVY